MARFLFGPVHSRRLGRSLGIDLLPSKVCSFDCLYCECGWTTTKTLDRSELVPTADVLAEIDEFFATDPQIDIVTFAGAGEPTLHSGIGTIIAHLKTHYPQYKVCVLTNGSLLGDAAVQKDLSLADIVVPSLDGATNASYKKICRPVHGLDVETVIAAIASFRKTFSGQFLLEVFVVPGINDSDAELEALKHAAERIAPEAIQLNSLDRPAAFSRLRAATREELLRIRSRLHPIPVQIFLGRPTDVQSAAADPAFCEELEELLKLGPTTLNRLSLVTRLRENELADIISQMSAQGRDFEVAGDVVRKKNQSTAQEEGLQP